MYNKNKRQGGAKSGREALRKNRDRQFGSRQPGLKNGPVVTGRVQMTRDGYVFVIVENETDNDVFVKASKTKGALNGDTVKCVITREGSQEGKTDKGSTRRREGEITEIVQRSRKPFVGVLHTVGQQAWVLMQSKNMPYDISVDFSELPEGSKRGMKVAAVIDDWKRGEPNPRGHIVDVLGMPGENDTEMHAILAEYGLPYRFEPEVENAADSISDQITPKDVASRRDFRDTLTFTIDPEDAKDFDDALSFKRLSNGNYEIGVHIADVSWYVRPDTVVDKEAQSRGTSVYLVDRTVPMLPEKLSNKLCSLRPNEDKLTFSAVFEITPQAEVKDRWFGRTVIRSDYRFAYETAQQIIDNGDAAMTMELRGGTDGKTTPVADPVLEASPEAAAKSAGKAEAAMGEGVFEGCVIPQTIKEAILDMHKVATLLRKHRFAAGAISFDRPEMKVEVDAAGRPVKVYEKITKEANWLIEEYMLLANRSVAEFIATSGRMDGKADKDAKTFVYRVHGEPNTEKIGNLSQFVSNFGYKMGPIGNGQEVARSLNTLLAAAKGTPESDAFEMIALRSMAKAIYTTDNIGHYGLAFKFYTHFTSPIRRYPDTMVHRLLALYLEKGGSQNKEYYEEQCQHASEREQIAANAERDSVKYKLIEFMQDKIGQEFEGTISGLTDWGMYVEIKPTMIEGMVALRDIRSDFFDFDEENYLIKGKRTGKTFRLGDPVKIRVKAANLDQRILDYELIDPNAGSAPTNESEDRPDRKPEFRGKSRQGFRGDSRRRTGESGGSASRGKNNGHADKRKSGRRSNH